MKKIIKSGIILIMVTTIIGNITFSFATESKQELNNTQNELENKIDQAEENLQEIEEKKS